MQTTMLVQGMWGWILCAACATGQVITTVAGTDWSFPAASVAAADAPLGGVSGLAVDANSNVYLADLDNNLVLRMSRDGVLTVVAGNGRAGFSGDGGPATNASLNAPRGLAVDTAGNIYIADSGNYIVRK